jgi:hypothetical protein
MPAADEYQRSDRPLWDGQPPLALAVRMDWQVLYELARSRLGGLEVPPEIVGVLGGGSGRR